MKRLLIQVGLLQVPLLLSTVMVQAQKKKDTVKTSKIDEVVVTAYGIKKEKKSLGYVYQDIKGTTLVDARENNITNALVGKVSALQLVKSTAGPAASSKIILRGYNSLTNDNQPLIVVDGVPMVNFLGASNNDFWNPSADMGNGLSDINPEDIDNVTVLKGGAASALYGSRAGNGVIMITTKNGKNRKGIGITISETVGFSEMMQTPRIQSDFGLGTNGVYPTAFTDQTGSSSWGPKIEGQNVLYWDGTTRPLRTYDNLSHFFQTGSTNTHTFSISNRVGTSTDLYTSASYMTDEGLVMDSKYKRLNLMTRATSKFGHDDRWSTDIKVQFMNSRANNRPVSGNNSGNFYSTVLLMPTSIDINDFRNGMDVKGSDPYWWKPGSYGNPFWMIHNVLNEDVRNRFLMNGTLKYQFNSWLDADVRIGTDMYNTKYEGRSYVGKTIRPVPNNYSTGIDRNYENNYIASITAHKDDLVGKWSASASLFGQIMQSEFNSVSASGALRVPNYFTVGNISNSNPSSEGFSKRQINSVFATADINYDNFWFIGASARNDWSSTMAQEHRSYFYPSVNTSLIVTDMFKKLFNTDPGKVLTFAKLRASYAVTGNSLPAYQLYNVYGIGTGANGTITGYSGNILFDPNVVAELIKTKEFGVNLRFFNRVDVDVNYYDTHATNQLINLPMNPLSGYSARKINAGDIQNKGWELTVNADIIRSTNFKWNMLVNGSANKNKIIDIYPGVTQYSLGGYDSVSMNAIPGGYYGSIFGTTFNRVDDPNSPFFGKIILSSAGLPTANTTRSLLGDQTPRGLLGITNSFVYKDWGLSFQIDGRFGGKFFSGTQRALLAAGLSPETVVNGGRDSFVVDGVISDGAGGYVASNIAVTPQNYWAAVTGSGGNLGINEAFIFDATNIRLRNIQLTYNLPKKFLTNTALQSARASFSVNNVWMFKSAIKGIDPESVYAVGSNAVGFESMSFPTLRTYLFNITLGF